MTRKKIIRNLDPRHVIYEPVHWKHLRGLRERAKAIGELLEKVVPPDHILFHGSLARGDVHSASDIDLILPYGTFLTELELLLSSSFNNLERTLVMATPNGLPKGVFELEHGVTLSLPLLPPSQRELSFYRFAGLISLELLRVGFGPESVKTLRSEPTINITHRVAGVDKRLVFIQPVENGHLEMSLMGCEVEVSRKTGIPMDIIEERIRVLVRRDRVGRTGVYLNQPLSPDQGMLESLRELAHRDPVIRRSFKDRE